jgi:hypothetical protein
MSPPAQLRQSRNASSKSTACRGVVGERGGGRSIQLFKDVYPPKILGISETGRPPKQTHPPCLRVNGRKGSQGRGMSLGVDG